MVGMVVVDTPFLPPSTLSSFAVKLLVSPGITGFDGAIRTGVPVNGSLSMNGGRSPIEAMCLMRLA